MELTVGWAALGSSAGAEGGRYGSSNVIASVVCPAWITPMDAVAENLALYYDNIKGENRM